MNSSDRSQNDFYTDESRPDYKVRLELFEGPLDLLLHLIRKNEVDIFDIPIAQITDQYLAYLDMMQALNLNVAGDFLVMASTLIHIKSKMLLPKTDEESDEAEEDPRLEITRPLMEYLQLKEVAGELSERDMLDRDTFARRLTEQFRDQLEDAEPLLDVNLFQLIDAFKKIIEQRLPGAQLTFKPHKWSLREKTTQIMERLKQGAIYFIELFEGHTVIGEFIVTFLALLELVHQGLVRVYQPVPDKDIRLEGRFQEENGISG